MNAYRQIGAACAAMLLLAGCAGGGRSPLPHAADTHQGASQSAPLSLVVRVPGKAASSSQRRPAYVSPATTHVQITLVSNNGTTINYHYGDSGSFPITPSTPGCVQQPNGSLQCTITLVTPNNTPVVGNDVFELIMMDDGNAALSHALVPISVSPTQSTSIPVTLNGVVAAAAVSLSNPTPAPGSTSATNVVVTAKDADGYTIVGPGGYDTPITLADSDSSGATSLSTTTVNAPGQAVSLTFNGDARLQFATIRPSVAGANIAASKLVPDVLLPQPQPPYVWVSIHSNSGSLGPYGWLIGYPVTWMLEGTPAVRPGPVIVTPGVNVSKVAVDHAGNVYADYIGSGVSDSDTQGIYEFAAGATGQATPMRTMTPAKVIGMNGFTVDPSGNVWAVGNGYPTDQPGNQPSALLSFAAGSSTDTVAYRDTSNNVLNAVHSIRADGAGHVFVTNTGSANPPAPGYVFRFGGTLTSINYGDSDIYNIPEPNGLGLDSAGNVFVGVDVPGGGSRIDVYNGASFPSGANGSVQSNGLSNLPSFAFNGVDTDAQGNLYAAGTYGKLLVFAASTYNAGAPFSTPSATPITTFQCCFNPADPSGNGIVPVPAGLVPPGATSGVISLAVQR